jgi:23S rRNA pseudouridine2457 synthase
MKVIKFWKPFNVLTQFTDKDGRKTLADYIKVPHIYAAGRLDYDSEGLLILTDDGGLNARMTQPKYEHPKTYWAQVERIPTPEALQALRDGVTLSDGVTRKALVKVMEDEPRLPERSEPIRFRKNVPTAWIELTITEGRNRQVRRMTAAVGHPTLRLVRWAIGNVTLNGVSEGRWEDLMPNELVELERSIKTAKPKKI